MATEFKDKERGVRFTLPEKINVRDQLRYFDALASDDVSDLERYWMAAVSIIQDWECEKLPDIDKADLEKIYDLDVTGIVIWTGTTVLNHMNRTEGTPKN